MNEIIITPKSRGVIYDWRLSTIIGEINETLFNKKSATKNIG